VQVENNRNTLEGNKNLSKENVKSTDLQNLQYWRIIKQINIITHSHGSVVRATIKVNGEGQTLTPRHP